MMLGLASYVGIADAAGGTRAGFGLSIAAVAATITGLRLGPAAAKGADAQLAMELGARKYQVSSRATQMRVREAERFVHDQVLHTLRVIALERIAVSAAVARGSACAVADAWRTMPPPECGLLAQIRRVALTGEISGLRVRACGRARHLPQDVENALVQATREALTNAARHAGAAVARVAITQRGTRVRVSITDLGAGFDETLAGQGITGSLQQRMRDVGGRAEISSATGRGTRVCLTWAPQIPESEGARHFHAGCGAAGKLPRVCALAVSPLVAHGLIATVVAVLVLGLKQYWPLWVVAGILAGLYLVAIVRFRQGFGLGYSLLLTGGIWLAITAEVMAWHLREHGPSMVLAGTAIALVALQLLYRPRRAGLVTLLGALVIVMSAPEQFRASHVLVGGVIVALIWVRFTLDVVGKFALLHQESELGRWRASITSEHLHPAVMARCAEAMEFIGGVAAGNLDPEDPTVRARAADLEQIVRHGGSENQDDVLEQRILEMRNAGIEVALRSAVDLPPAASAWLADIAEKALRADAAALRASVTEAAGDLRVGVTVVPAAGLIDQLADRPAYAEWSLLEPQHFTAIFHPGGKDTAPGGSRPEEAQRDETEKDRTSRDDTDEEETL